MHVESSTIGDDESGASNRAADDCEALFILLWHLPDPPPVTGGRGTSAEDDWAAHKAIQLPEMAGRAIGVAGQGAGLSLRALGARAGVEGFSQSVAQMAGHAHGPAPGFSSFSNFSGENPQVYVCGAQQSYIYSTVPSTNTQGAGGTMGVMQPTVFQNLMIKL
jgi:hypothetical protein